MSSSMIRRLLASRVEPVAVLSTMRSASSGRKDLGGAVGSDKGGVEPAFGDPPPGQPLVLRGDDQRDFGKDSVRGKGGRRGGHDPHRIETGVHELDEFSVELGDPVGAGKTDIPRTGVEHLDDALGFEDLDLALGQVEMGPVVARGLDQIDPGVGQKLRHAVVHPALGYCQLERFVIGSSGHHASWAPTAFRQKKNAGGAGVVVSVEEIAYTITWPQQGCVRDDGGGEKRHS